MDYYLSEKHCYDRLESEFKKYGKLILCVDFDDTVFDFHKLGREYNDVISLLRRWQPYSEIIVFTGNGDDKYQMITKYMNEHGVEIRGVNCDSSVVVSGRKVYANVYIDDRGGLPLVYKNLLSLIEKIERGEIH